MSTLVPVVLRQGNDEVLRMTIIPDDPLDDLTHVTLLVLIMKDDACTADSDASVLTLDSGNPAEIAINEQIADRIVATAYIPAAALSEPYGRVWRVDAYVGTKHRTALYGPVTVVDL
jgi:hypothetical protein